MDALLDEMQGRGLRADLIADFAARIPVEVIGNLLDVPHAERAPLRDWSLAILSALEPAPSASQLTRGHESVRGFLAYLADLVARRRARPGDPARFADPDRLDIARKPNLHLAFGHGAHACAGMNVARLEARVAIGALARRVPRLELDGTPQRDPRIRFRGWRRLPVTLA